MNYFLKSKYLLFLSYGVLIIFFLNAITTSLINGGGWDLNEHISFGDRVINGFPSYANGITDLFFPSSPYFPGVGYLSAFFQYLGLKNLYLNNQLMLITASFIGFVYFLLLKKLTAKLYPSIPNIIVTPILILLFATHFSSYISYMGEFKPDTILLVCGLIMFFILEKNVKVTYLETLIVAALLFASVFFKQSFFLIYFFILLSVFTNKFYDLQEKIIFFFLASIICFYALYIILNIDNLFYFTIEIMSKHSIRDFKAILLDFGKGLSLNFIYSFGLIYFIITNYKQFSISDIRSKYFIFSTAWFMFSVISTAKTGGNIGNFEVGVVVFMPFVIYSLHSILMKFYSNSHFYQLIFFILLGIFGFNFYNFIKNTNNLNDTIQMNTLSIEYLSENFEGKSVFVDGDTYILAKMSSLNVLTEAETISHFNDVPKYGMHKIKQALLDQKYDLIFLKTAPKYYKDIEKIIDIKYEVFVDNKMPSYLVNKILKRKGV